MTDSIQLALQLLLVGMCSVFVILGIVVGLGRSLIYLVGRFAKEEQKVVARPISQSNNTISNKHVVVLSTVVDIVTKGKGVISSIEKK